MSSVAKGQVSLAPDTSSNDDGDISEDIEFIEHAFVLRPDLPVSFELPADLTEHEASRIAAFIQTLPFGEG